MFYIPSPGQVQVPQPRFVYRTQDIDTTITAKFLKIGNDSFVPTTHVWKCWTKAVDMLGESLVTACPKEFSGLITTVMEQNDGLIGEREINSEALRLILGKFLNAEHDLLSSTVQQPGATNEFLSTPLLNTLSPHPISEFLNKRCPQVANEALVSWFSGFFNQIAEPTQTAMQPDNEFADSVLGHLQTVLKNQDVVSKYSKVIDMLAKTNSGMGANPWRYATALQNPDRFKDSISVNRNLQEQVIREWLQKTKIGDELQERVVNAWKSVSPSK